MCGGIFSGFLYKILHRKLSVNIFELKLDKGFEKFSNCSWINLWSNRFAPQPCLFAFEWVLPSKKGGTVLISGSDSLNELGLECFRRRCLDKNIFCISIDSACVRTNWPRLFVAVVEISIKIASNTPWMHPHWYKILRLGMCVCRLPTGRQEEVNSDSLSSSTTTHTLSSCSSVGRLIRQPPTYRPTAEEIGKKYRRPNTQLSNYAW